AGVGGFGATLVLLASAGLSLPVLLAIVAAGTAAAGYSSWWLCGDVVGRLDTAVAHLRDFAAGQYTHDIAIDRDDEVGGVLLGLKSMQVRLGFEIEDRRREAEQMARVLSALDAAPTSVLVADHAHAIVYANPAARAMLAAVEADVRAACPTFSAADLDGSPLPALAHDPDAQRATLAGLSSPHPYRVAFRAHTFDVTATPVLSGSGARLGTVAEWRDRSAELALEREVEAVVAAAADGDFSRRVDLHGATGFVQTVGRGLERLMQAT